MEIRFLGGTREVGRSAVLVNDSLLLDYGMRAGTPPAFPVGSVDPDAVVVSHGHLDHVGAVPALLSGDDRPTIHWTPPTAEMARVLARDTLKLQGGRYDCPFTGEAVKRLAEVSVTHGYGEPFEAAGHRVTFHDAGHVPGSAHVLVEERTTSRPATDTSAGGDTRLLYTGDFHTADQRLVAGTTARPDADVVICESTYADVEREDRSRIEERFAERVRTTLWDGGTVVIPAFAIGRTQELLLICDAHDVDAYVDGMGTRVTERFRRRPDFVRDPAALDRAASRARVVTGGDDQRRRIAGESAAIVTTSGMLSGGPAATYVPEIRGDPTNLVALTGYQVAGTPGRELLDSGRAEFDGRVLPVSARVESFDFSAHADRDGLRSFLDAYRDASVFVVHGDRCESFAGELRAAGHDATAPALGSVHVR